MSGRTAGLCAVFLISKLITLYVHAVPLSPLLPLAWFWQDAVVVAVFACGERVLKAKWFWRIVYSALVLLTAFGTPVSMDLGSPLTGAMLRAARGTLADSIRHHATPVNIMVTGGLLLVAVLVPLFWKRRDVRTRTLVVAGLIALVVGQLAAARVDTRGMERNPVFALAGTVLPRVRGESYEEDWRQPLQPRTNGAPNDKAVNDTLRALRGAASGSNVLMVVLESTGAQYLQPWGAAEDPMPTLSALATRSILFENAYALYPESVKGLVSYLSSRYPGFDVPNARHGSIASPSIATQLGSAGYETALFHSGRFMYLGMEELLAGTGFGLLEDAGHISGNHNSSFGVDEPAAVARILQWIDSVPRGKRFFAAYLPIAGHHPYVFTAPARFPGTEELDRYRNSLFDADRALSILLDGLRQRGLDSSTVVVVMADHGEAFGQHPGNYGHTLGIYEENMKVPLLLTLPEGRRVPARVHRSASLLDVAPTVLDLLGVASPPEFQGTSLLDDGDRMALFFTDYSLGLLGARDGCIKYIYEMEPRRSRMFDVCADPGEQNDIAGNDAKMSRLYRDRLMRWIAAAVGRIPG